MRLERHIEGQKKIGNWKWRDNPFTGTRQFNGLRVMMALMNSWDLKDENNAIYERERRMIPARFMRSATWEPASAPPDIAGPRPWQRAISNLTAIPGSSAKRGPEFVDFNIPTRPALIYFFNVPGLIHRLRMRWIGRHIPREDAKWMGDILSRLSPEQIQDAFRSAGYSPQEVEGFSKVVQERIAELTKL